MSMPALRRFTAEEYLVTERMSNRRHEFVDGVIYNMAGASEPHNIITMNLAGNLFRCVKSRGCRIYSNDMRVQIPRKTLYAYPDVVVVCGEPELADSHNDTLLNPTILIEVLSPSTADFDRNVKAKRYRRILSLQEFLLVEQDECYIEHFRRESDTSWDVEKILNLKATLRFASLGCEIPVSEVYDQVTFPGSG